MFEIAFITFDKVLVITKKITIGANTILMAIFSMCTHIWKTWKTKY